MKAGWRNAIWILSPMIYDISGIMFHDHSVMALCNISPGLKL